MFSLIVNFIYDKICDFRIDIFLPFLYFFIYSRNNARDYWKYANRESLSKMRLKLEPNLYHNPHTVAANLRDNTTIEERYDP